MVIIRVSHDGTTCDVFIPGQFTIMFTSESIISAIDFCVREGLTYRLEYAEIKPRIKKD